MAVVSQPVQQRRGQLGVAKHRRPFAEVEIAGDKNTGALIKLREQVEQQGASALAEGQIAQLIQYHQIHMHQPVGQLTLLARGLFQLKCIDQLNGGQEADSTPMALDGLDPYRGGQMRLPAARPANEHNILGGAHELSAMQLLDQRLAPLDSVG